MTTDVIKKNGSIQSQIFVYIVKHLTMINVDSRGANLVDCGLHLFSLSGVLLNQPLAFVDLAPFGLESSGEVRRDHAEGDGWRGSERFECQ